MSKHEASTVRSVHFMNLPTLEDRIGDLTSRLRLARASALGLSRHDNDLGDVDMVETCEALAETLEACLEEAFWIRSMPGLALSLPVPNDDEARDEDSTDAAAGDRDAEDWLVKKRQLITLHYLSNALARTEGGQR